MAEALDLCKPRAPAAARPLIQDLEGSKIREVANGALGRPDVLPFWFGESDEPTPGFIRDAAISALAEDRTFYTHNLGRADLRETIARYLCGLHGTAIGPDRMAVTTAGVNALMVAAQAVVDPGDRVVVVTPVWPNVAEIPRILSAEVVRVPIAPKDGRWGLDLDRLLDALTPRTRLLLINSPNNPTGWTLDPDHRDAILEHCRARGIWIVSDDVYERLNYDCNARSAPSFLPLIDPEDRLISANSFSKAWRMTGWRLGWLVAPERLMADLGKLLEYNTSCAPDFVQQAGITAIRDGEAYIAASRAALRAKRDRLLMALRSLPGVEAPTPAGGMYVFFRPAGCGDSVTLAKRLIDQAGLGLAPGRAFGGEGEGWLRWCFAAEAHKLDEGVRRITRCLGR